MPKCLIFLYLMETKSISATAQNYKALIMIDLYHQKAFILLKISKVINGKK